MANSTGANNTFASDIFHLKHVQKTCKAYLYVRLAESLIVFAANAVTILAVVKFQNLNRKPHNILIVGLALADSFLGKCEVFGWKFSRTFVFFDRLMFHKH